MSKIAYATLALCLWINSSLALEGKVVGVHDGDTLTILDKSKTQYKIRLAQIDAPELGQSWGRNSKNALMDLVINKVIKVEVIDIDRYGRQVGTVFVGDVDVCREQVATGNAWIYRRYMTDSSLLANEEQAQNEGLGLWGEQNPIPPWEWRKRSQ